MDVNISRRFADGRPPAGYFTKRTADGWLRDRLDEARRGGLPDSTRSGATLAEAAAEWLRYIEHDRKRKPSTVEGYASIVRTQLLPTFGSMAIESITPAAIERWLGSLEHASSSRTKSLVLLRGIFQRARKGWGLAVNPVTDVKPPLERSGDVEVFSPEEVWALVRAAGSERDGEHWTGDDDLMFAGEGADPASRRVEIARHTMGQCSSARCQGC